MSLKKQKKLVPMFEKIIILGVDLSELFKGSRKKISKLVARPLSSRGGGVGGEGVAGKGN